MTFTLHSLDFRCCTLYAAWRLGEKRGASATKCMEEAANLLQITPYILPEQHSLEQWLYRNLLHSFSPISLSSSKLVKLVWWWDSRCNIVIKIVPQQKSFTKMPALSEMGKRKWDRFLSSYYSFLPTIYSIEQGSRATYRPCPLKLNRTEAPSSIAYLVVVFVPLFDRPTDRLKAK